jgi:uncharacterized protein
MVNLIDTGPADGPSLLFAHGAGAPMDSVFMHKMAELLAERGVRVLRFEFAYMAARREGDKRPPPPNMSKLLAEFKSVIETLPPGPLAIGGKSMGGRAASLIAEELFDAGRIRKLVLFGYPFHPPTKPEHLRTAHLEKLTCPTLLLQGDRDPFGTKEEVELYPLSRKIRTAWLADGDHDFKPRVASGHTWKENLNQAADDAANFIYA